MGEAVTIIRVLVGKADQKLYKVTTQTTLIGSGQQCDIRLHQTDIPHVQLILQKVDDNYIVRRSGELPLIVNGIKRDQTVLRGGEELTVGKCILKFETGEGAGLSLPAYSAGDKYDQPTGAQSAARKSKLYLMLGVYYLLFMVGVLFLLLRESTDTWLVPERIEGLNSAYEQSQLPVRDAIRERAYEVLFDARSVPLELTRQRLRDLLVMTASTSPEAGDVAERFEDPLRAFLLNQYRSFGTMQESE